eukprot:PITA_29420
MEPDKAPGLDGFTPRFLQTCWQIVEKELFKMIQKSQECQKIGGCTNSAFLTLIPKEKGANPFNRFRPISLCNIGYKVITKVIANRLKKILPKIIPENQGGFIHGRQLVDNFILVQEAIHSSLRRKEKSMVIKLDLANAFDHVRHRFLFVVLHKLGFGQNFIKWIRACISEPWIAPLVNGRVVDFFKTSRGLRQGCPLSPLLFVLQASILSFYLNKKQQDQDIVGLFIARGVKSINHALFADDTLLQGAATQLFASKFKEVLEDYCQASGSELNRGKCHVYCWNISAVVASSIARCLGFATSASWTSFKYLGLPIFHKRAMSKDWHPEVEKFKAKMQAWGSSWLNIAGKSVLIQSVLSSLLLFQFFVLLAPVGIIKRMEELIRKFLWKGGKHNEKIISLINWEIVSRPLQEGGLNYKNLSTQNLAMGAKLIWKIIAPKPGWVQLALWRKYFRGQRLRCLEQPKVHNRTPLSTLIIKIGPLIRDNAYWIPGNGKHIRLWDDSIMNRPPLVNSNLRNKLKSDYDTLLKMLHGVAPLHARRKDTRGWGLKQIGYTVAQGYAKFMERPHVPPNPVPWTSIWNFPTIPKNDHFCWLLCHQKILTDDMLQKRGFLGPSRCTLCKKSPKSSLHLSLACNYTGLIWHEVLGSSKFMPNFPHSVPDLFVGWLARHPGPSPKNKIVKEAWTALPKFISWQIWLERNRRIFIDKEQNFKLVANTVKGQLNEWLRDKSDDTNLSQQDTEFGATLNLNFQKSKIPPICLKYWQIRKIEEEFQSWLSKQTLPSLFFDGAAKGNPGMARAGGLIINTEEASIHKFAWGLGHSSSKPEEDSL